MGRPHQDVAARWKSGYDAQFLSQTRLEKALSPLRFEDKGYGFISFLGTLVSLCTQTGGSPIWTEE